MARESLFVVAFLILFLPVAAGADGLDCYSIVAGRAATADGSVLVGHNEDNAVTDIAAFKKIPRRNRGRGEWIDLEGGGRLAQAEITYSCWWLQMPDQDHSDAYLNEFGVVVVSDSCPSREDRNDFTDGGIGGPQLRRIAVERSRTARETVELLGSLVERFGYTASGRTMIVADRDEGWLVGLVQGRRWAAARVPDDEVAVIANTYTIAEIDLDDRENFLASADLIDYAIERGWYDPADGAFSFEKAYAAPGSRRHTSNIHRQWTGIRLLAAEPVPAVPPEVGPLSFSVKPKEPLAPAHLAAVLRDHYETAPVRFKRRKGRTSPHEAHTSPVCSPRANSSSIFQLRSKVPVEVGAVWWYALWQPCSTPYMPLYLGTADAPALLRFGGTRDAEAAPAYAIFNELARWVDKDYAARIGPVAEAWRVLEAANFRFQETFESHLVSLWKDDRSQARALMTSHCYGVVARAVEQARAFLADG